MKKLLTICAVLMMFAVSAVAQDAIVNVSLEPSTKTVLVGDTFDLDLCLKSSDGSTIMMADAHLLLEWDPAYVGFSGSASTTDGDYDWTTAMCWFPGTCVPMYPFEGSWSWNETYDDGDAKINLYPGAASFQGMAHPQTDLKAVTLTFTALAVNSSTLIDIRPMTWAECGVTSGIIEEPTGIPIGGIGIGADVSICDPLMVTCTGFEPPMDKEAVKVKKNRVLPLKAQLLADGQALTDAEIIAPPVIQVIFQPTVGDAKDVSDDALSAGQGTEGNQFEFSDGKWQFNLKTKNYTGAGTYTITMVSEDDCEYVIESPCTATFVIE